VRDRAAGATAPDDDDVWQVGVNDLWHVPHLLDEVRSSIQAIPGYRRHD